MKCGLKNGAKTVVVDLSYANIKLSEFVAKETQKIIPHLKQTMLSILDVAQRKRHRS